jgi:MFS family permease
LAKKVFHIRKSKNNHQNLSLAMQKKQQALFTYQFFVLCLSTALFSASFNMIIPELPDYLTDLGGAEYKGLIIGLFTLTAGLSRPLSGKLTDSIGRIPVMVVGTLVCVIASLFYPFVLSVSAFLALRLFHGFSTGFKPTATTAYVADIVPSSRVGEAMGILGISMNLGASIAPPIGSYFALLWSLDVMFYISSALAVISVLLLIGLQETHADKEPVKWSSFKITLQDVYDPTAIAPGIVTVFTYAGFGVMLTIVPDQSTFVGLENKGMFFTVFTLASITSRLFAGRFSDIYGPIPVMKVATIGIAIGMAIMGKATTPLSLMVGSSVLGFTAGMNSPAVFAWAIDRCNPAQRGRAMATVYIALEIGIGMGAVISAWIYNNDYDRFDITFFTFAVLTLIAPIYLQFIFKDKTDSESQT